MYKEQYLQIFQYLHDFSKLRGKPVRSIKDQSGNYPEVIWLSDIPEHVSIQNITAEDNSEDIELWLSIKKPEYPGDAPVFEDVPERLKPWIVEESLLDDEEFPILQDEIEQDEHTIFLEDHPEIKEEFDAYVDQQWLKDLEIYQEKARIYEEKLKEFELLNENYKRFFAIYNKANRFGEEYELVIGLGLLSYGGRSKNAKIYRHTFTAKAEMDYDPDHATISIAASPQELNLHIEDDFIADLEEDFTVEDIRDAESNCKKILEKHEVSFLPFDEKVKEAMQAYTHRLSPDARFYDSLSRPEGFSQEPSIYFAPALILRKRNTLGLTKMYEQIIQDIKVQPDDFEVDIMGDVLGKEDISYEPGDEASVQSPELEDDLIYFPKKYNDEQLKIIEKTRRNHKVLVQGPPGTGKSHTIANLISHLLANGQKILVTAATQRALKVLKHQLPEEVRSLAVNLLGRDNESLKDLESSVNVINEKHESLQKEELRATIDQKRVRVDALKSILADKENQLLSIQEKAFRRNEFNDLYQGTLLEVAQKLYEDQLKYEWFRDEITATTKFDTLSDIQSFYDQWKHYQSIDTSDLAYDFPSPDKLISSQTLKEFVNLKQQESDSKNKFGKDLKPIYTHKLDDCEKVILRMKEVIKQAMSIDIPYYKEVLFSYIKGEHELWHAKVKKTEKLNEDRYFMQLNHISSNYDISLPSNARALHLKEDAKILGNYLFEGNTLSGALFTLKKPFLPVEIKERLDFPQKVKVNGRPCLTVEQFEWVFKYLDYVLEAEDFSRLWKISSPHAHTTEDILKYVKVVSEQSAQLLVLGKELHALNQSLVSAGIYLQVYDEDELNHYLEVIAYHRLSYRLQHVQRELESSIAELSHPKLHPVAKELQAAIHQQDIYAYDDQLNNLAILTQKKKRFVTYNALSNSIRTQFPELVEDIQNQRISKENIQTLPEAVQWRQAKQQVEFMLRKDSEELLSQEILDIENEIQSLLEELAVSKAWLHLVERLEDKQSLKRHLNAWKLAVKRIGKTGKGKRALKFRTEAQYQMENCKEAIPCWIMPLYKVAESFIPRPQIFDYVIVDEASQLGPDAIFLLYITKKIIIVGDDKQTSPEYVGIGPDPIKALTMKHLKGIPFDNFYGTEFSFFDFASIFCHSGLITLREHFRCMPEIIEFSNKHFYEPDGKVLYPLKQYSANRLEPLKTTYCSDGYVEGSSSHIRNLPEAEAIVAQIKACVADKNYENKSFGVICLQGRIQAELIEKLLIDNIGPDEIEKRRIICGTSASFQGDERDVMFLSLVTAHNHNRAALTKPEDERRFNVAVSRAKEQAWLFHSVQLADLRNSEDLRYKILDHFQNYQDNPVIFDQVLERTKGNQPEPFESWFEVDVYNTIVRKGYKLIPQYKVAGGQFRIDLAVVLKNGTLIAVECDGDHWHGPEQYQKDMARQKMLERCGWQFFRVRGSEFYLDGGKQAMEPLWELLKDNDVEIASEAETVKADVQERISVTNTQQDLFSPNSQQLFDFRKLGEN